MMKPKARNPDAAALQTAIETQHKCAARFREFQHVHETYNNHTVWDADVAVFDLADHPTATVGYAWSDQILESDRVRFYAVLQAGPVQTPADAVRAAIVHRYREVTGT
jgi:hypothetical protein